MYHVHANVPGGQKGALDPQELELHTVRYHIGARNRTRSSARAESIHGCQAIAQAPHAHCT